MAVVIVLLGIVLGLVLVMLRTFRNVGPLSLEERARREQIAYIPISLELLENMGGWSQPVRLKASRSDELLVDLAITTNLGDDDV